MKNTINYILFQAFLFLVGILCGSVVFLGLFLWTWYDNDMASIYLNISCLLAIIIFSLIILNGLIINLIDGIIEYSVYRKLRKLFVKGKTK